jgi:hypothetical protein
MSLGDAHRTGTSILKCANTNGAPDALYAISNGILNKKKSTKIFLDLKGTLTEFGPCRLMTKGGIVYLYVSISLQISPFHSPSPCLSLLHIYLPVLTAYAQFCTWNWSVLGGNETTYHIKKTAKLEDKHQSPVSQHNNTQ